MLPSLVRAAAAAASRNRSTVCPGYLLGAALAEARSALAAGVTDEPGPCWLTGLAGLAA